MFLCVLLFLLLELLAPEHDRGAQTHQGETRQLRPQSEMRVVAGLGAVHARGGVDFIRLLHVGALDRKAEVIGLLIELACVDVGSRPDIGDFVVVGVDRMGGDGDLRILLHPPVVWTLEFDIAAGGGESGQAVVGDGVAVGSDGIVLIHRRFAPIMVIGFILIPHPVGSGGIHRQGGALDILPGVVRFGGRAAQNVLHAGRHAADLPLLDLAVGIDDVLQRCGLGRGAVDLVSAALDLAGLGLVGDDADDNGKGNSPGQRVRPNRLYYRLFRIYRRRL